MKTKNVGERKYKDNAENRLMAIEAYVGMDASFDIDCYLHLKNKQTPEQTMRLLKEANEIITAVYKLAHGHSSDCCKGKGEELIDPAIRSYAGDNWLPTQGKKK